MKTSPDDRKQGLLSPSRKGKGEAVSFVQGPVSGPGAYHGPIGPRDCSLFTDSAYPSRFVEFAFVERWFQKISDQP